MPEWLGSGLQNRARGFKSHSVLHCGYNSTVEYDLAMVGMRVRFPLAAPNGAMVEGMNAFYVVALVSLVLAVIAFFAVWPVSPFLIVALVAAVIGFFADRSGSGRW